MLVAILVFAPLSLEAGELTVVANQPNPSDFYLKFFQEFNAELIAWWQNDGKRQVEGKWGVFVIEDEPPLSSNVGSKRLEVVVFIIRDQEPAVPIPVTRISPQRVENLEQTARWATKKTAEKLIKVSKDYKESSPKPPAPRREPRIKTRGSNFFIKSDRIIYT